MSEKPFQWREEGALSSVEALLMASGSAPISGGFGVRWEGQLHFKLNFLVTT